MALLWADGFDHYAVGDILKMWTTLTSAGGSIVTGRTGSALRFFDSSTPSGVTKKMLPASGNVAIFGIAYRISQINASAGGIITCGTGTAAHFTLQKDGTTALLSLRQGGMNGTVIATSGYTVPVSTWIYIEVKVALATGTTGSYEVRVNGQTIMSGSGVVTTPVGATWSAVAVIQTPSAAATCNHDGDDFYACDGSGVDNNDFLGDVKIETLLPSTDAVSAGSNAGLTPSTGTDHGALVDEATANTTDWNGSSSVGSKDTYNYPSLATTSGVVAAVVVCPWFAKSDAGARQMQPVVRVGGTDYDGVAVYPSAVSYLYFPQIYERDPTSTLWTISSVNSAEFGAKVAA